MKMENIPKTVTNFQKLVKNCFKHVGFFLGILGNKRDSPIYPGQILGMRKKLLQWEKTRESSRWGQFNILGNDVDKYDKILKSRVGMETAFLGNLALLLCRLKTNGCPVLWSYLRLLLGPRAARVDRSHSKNISTIKV